ncbi:PrsW family intramembrane metalloprotease [Candidatus Peregrinibacteria bacterium]|nr:MAG: PrsW family intramembrane metalloprotease [Candidatus Peregrinibacteria bacterium]
MPSLSSFFLALCCATIPVTLWFFILRRKGSEKNLGRFFLTFFLSGVGAFLFLWAEPRFMSHIQSTGFLLFLFFVVFGGIIEYYKNSIVRLCGTRFFRNIDDVLDLSFAAALGFAFFENFIVFLGAFLSQDMGLVKLTKFLLLQGFFITPIHLFCSGVFGYFYGMGLFAGEELREKNNSSLSFRFFSPLFSFFSPDSQFKATKILQGTILSILIYGIFYWFLKRDFYLSDFLGVFGFSFQIDEQLIPFIALFYFQTGTLLFFTLMDKKRRWASRGLLLQK